MRLSPLCILVFAAQFAQPAQPAPAAQSGKRAQSAQREAVSLRSPADFPLTADPTESHWRDAPVAIAETDPFGQPLPAYRTEVRSRWTQDYLYVLFVCPYEDLHLKPGPAVTTSETNQLWNWDVAEIFIGFVFSQIHRYKEFEISPRGEWVDLDIDRHHPLPDGGLSWNSGFETQARIDAPRKIWYGEMKIPFRAIASSPPAPGTRFRVNFYRAQGSPSNRILITWSPTHQRNFHVPEAFGILRLE